LGIESKVIDQKVGKELFKGVRKGERYYKLRSFSKSTKIIYDNNGKYYFF
jgi:hypothetical protein